MTRKLSLFLCLSLALGLVVPGCDVGAYVDSPGGPSADQAHTGDPAVAGLVMDTPTGFQLCSGALVAPRVILTSASCVEGATAIFAGFGTAVAKGGTVDAFGGTVDAFGGTVDAFGGTVDAFTTPEADFLRATEWVVHPELESLPAASRSDADLALIHLSVDAAHEPVSVSDLPSALQSNVTLRAVGFGYASDAGAGVGLKHETTVAAGAVSGLSFEASSAAAAALSLSGDRGGPTFLTINGQEYVVGVHSMTGLERAGGSARDTRVDVRTSFIDDYLTRWQ